MYVYVYLKWATYMDISIHRPISHGYMRNFKFDSGDLRSNYGIGKDM